MQIDTLRVAAQLPPVLLAIVPVIQTTIPPPPPPPVSRHVCHQTIAHRTPIPSTTHHESQRLTLNVPPSTQVTPDSQISGRQSRRHHRQSSTPLDRSTCEASPQPPVPLSVPPSPLMRTCTGSLGVTCDILPDGAILQLGAGIALKRQMGDLYSSYLNDQHEDDKKYVINTLETEYGTGWSHNWMFKQMCKLMSHRRDAARRKIMVVHRWHKRWSTPHTAATVLCVSRHLLIVQIHLRPRGDGRGGLTGGRGAMSRG
ncbi:hypothetical protein L7F22_031034 [Adiantum nelumboides]|nr:hypothetical protein [Adiantum nelumboides]